MPFDAHSKKLVRREFEIVYFEQLLCLIVSAGIFLEVFISLAIQTCWLMPGTMVTTVSKPLVQQLQVSGQSSAGAFDEKKRGTELCRIALVKTAISRLSNTVLQIIVATRGR